jgi:PIN domain nuclease of toxin-antitoxin system
VRELLEDPATPVLVSAASARELSLKHHQGKLPELSGTSTPFS